MKVVILGEISVSGDGFGLWHCMSWDGLKSL